MDESPTTEPADATCPTNRRKSEVKSGVTLPPKVSELRWKLGRKAKQEPGFRFYVLYDRVYRLDVLTAAWWLVLKHKGAPGVDGMTCQAIIDGPGATRFLEAIAGRASHQDAIVRSRSNGSTSRSRTAGCDRWGFRRSKTGLSKPPRCWFWSRSSRPIFWTVRSDFDRVGRPTRRSKRSANTLATGQREVYDADLKAYFDTISHDNLMKCLQRRIADRSVLSLIRRWLQAVVVEEDDHGQRKVTRPKQGTPQGGVISPLLANIYLHWFEKAFHGPQGPAHWAKAKIVRYADDFVILAAIRATASSSGWKACWRAAFRLTINRQKTRVVDLKQARASLDFLGFTFRYDRDLHGRDHRYLNVFPSKSRWPVCGSGFGNSPTARGVVCRSPK